MRNKNESTIDLAKARTVISDGSRSRLARQGKCRLLIWIGHPDDLFLSSQLTQPCNMKRRDPSTAYESDPATSHGCVPRRRGYRISQRGVYRNLLFFCHEVSSAQNADATMGLAMRSEEHTSELQSLRHLAC